MAYDYDETTDGEKKAAAKGVGGGIVAVIVVIALAIGGWLYFNGKNDTPRSVGSDVTRGLEKAGDAVGSGTNSAKDAAAEVPQAASDAVTRGDQPTTRPNKDDSKDKLDQK